MLALTWYYPKIHHGVARFARDHGWHITADFEDLVPSHWNGDGVLALLGGGRDIWKRLRHCKVPIVDFAESRPNIELPRVTTDNVAIGRMAADHFLDRGYQHFAYVQRRGMGVSSRRRDSYRESIEAAGHRCDVLNWHRERERRNDTLDQRHRWLLRRLTSLPKPLAVFTSRDAEAVEVIDACLAAELDIPNEVAVLGVDNTEIICECLRVPLSSIENNWEQVGYEGAALLERLMRGESAPREPIYVPPSFVVERRSTDSHAVDHPKVVEAIRYLHENAAEPISMNQLFKAVGMSRSGLEKAFREHYIRAPAEELRNYRLTMAKKLLLETDKKVNVIAELAGFQTPHNLCRIFKQHVGTTPKQFRLTRTNRPIDK
ncbi:XylR family transcriptional regulator [Rhodopirellula sallentina]|uniref:Xylose operon regulatory protein n=1 Tax=Rhodopirellula sallentina SM41 TaxID=1263870 RepID=M5U449_9BACT|nr:DNA-binding transcriptional regulator [Rhodopirellula sallentina]EMI52646.1 xylose operon regulatory protein [Rhodopirellula sallentina SM41]